MEAIRGVNTDIQLKLGYAIVKNQSAQGMAEAGGPQTRADKLQEEDSFFTEHPILSQIPKDSRGLQALSERMTGVLVKLIQNFIPGCRETFRNELEKTSNELKELGTPPPRTRREQNQVLQDVMRRTSELLKEASERGPLNSSFREASEAFQKAIFATKPTFTDELELLEFHSDGTCVCTFAFEAIGDQDPIELLLEHGSPVRASPEAIREHFDAAARPLACPATHQGLTGELRMAASFKADVARMMKQHRGRELVGFYSFEAFEKIMDTLQGRCSVLRPLS